MAGRKRTKRDVSNWIGQTIRMPPELRDHLLHEAEKHHHSFNDEVVQKLIRAEFKAQQKAKLAALMALEPQLDDPRTDLEIAQQMEAIHQKYQESSWTQQKQHLDSLDIEVEVEWLNPNDWHTTVQEQM